MRREERFSFGSETICVDLLNQICMLLSTMIKLNFFNMSLSARRNVVNNCNSFSDLPFEYWHARKIEGGKCAIENLIHGTGLQLNRKNLAEYYEFMSANELYRHLQYQRDEAAKIAKELTETMEEMDGTVTKVTVILRNE